MSKLFFQEKGRGSDISSYLRFLAGNKNLYFANQKRHNTKKISAKIVEKIWQFFALIGTLLVNTN